MQKEVVPEDRVHVVERLRQEHQQIERRLDELDRHLSLTADEQRERLELKKLKLQKKDQIVSLTRGHA
jgi:hypothetical protein